MILNVKSVFIVIIFLVVLFSIGGCSHPIGNANSISISDSRVTLVIDNIHKNNNITFDVTFKEVRNGHLSTSEYLAWEKQIQDPTARQSRAIDSTGNIHTMHANDTGYQPVVITSKETYPDKGYKIIYYCPYPHAKITRLIIGYYFVDWWSSSTEWRTIEIDLNRLSVNPFYPD